MSAPRHPTSKHLLIPSRMTFTAVAVLTALASLQAQAQQTGAGTAAAAQSEIRTLESVVVRGDIAYRDRTDDTAPTLTYGQEYFQRFEPSTAGDMVKRVPSATFVSDVLEYDAVQLRGLEPAYTQVLINGKKVPGGSDDRSFWLDRIPAEMVDRVEVIRAPSANRSGDAMAGAINIVLRDAYEFDGTYIRAGGMSFDDGTLKPTFGLTHAGELLGGRILVSLSVQDRYNPKKKRSDRWDADGNFRSYENQTDTRDGQDYSGTLSYNTAIGDTGKLKLDAFYVQTDRTQKEVSKEVEYEDDGSFDKASKVPGFTDVDQTNYGFGAEYKFDMAGGETEIGFEYASFKDKNVEAEDKWEYSDENFASFDEGEREKSTFNSHDTEIGLKLAHKRGIGFGDVEFGLDYRAKDRVTQYENLKEEGIPTLHGAFGTGDGIEKSDPKSTITENRVDPYLMLSGKTGSLTWEAGLRYETTQTTIKSENGSVNNDYNTALPSLNLKYDLDDANRFTLSLAQTVRRPSFADIMNVTLEKEYDDSDSDWRGNPKLKPETANGIDLGYERRLGKRGVAGINFFYRDVQNLIEMVNTGETSAGGAGTVYSTDNTGNGQVWGVELDLSTPLSFVGLNNTGVFFNYSVLDSETKDMFGTRRFNNQAKDLLNVGFIQSLPSVQTSFGASYRKQGEAKSRVLGEEVTTTYGADLEAFVEKNIGKNFSLRLSANNLLNAEKKEVFHKYTTLEGQKLGESDEDDAKEIETEKAGSRIQLVARYAF